MRYSEIILYFRTIRRLTLRQLYYQLKKKLFIYNSNWSKKIHYSAVDPTVKVTPLDRWDYPQGHNLFENKFEFINKEACLIDQHRGLINWGFNEYGGLWLDHLNYFRFLDEFSSVISSDEQASLLNWLKLWIDGIKTGANKKALNPPYNASERIFSIGRFLIRNQNSLHHELDTISRVIMVRDLYFVCDNLEFHLGGNHLFKNLLSLSYGSNFFNGDVKFKCREKLKKFLKPEVRHQILSDGFHYELSPMYHNLCLLDVLDVLNVSKDESLNAFLHPLAKNMIGASKFTTHENGDFVFFNDCSLNLCPPSKKIVEYGESICGSQVVPHKLSKAGIYKLESDDGIRLFAKFGDLGAHEQMGHVHSDLFSFELSLGNDLVFVNSGTSTYYDIPFRDEERVSSAHNTITVNGFLQCEHWSFFRVAKSVSGINVYENSAEKSILGSTYLFKKNEKKYIERSIKVNNDNVFQIVDIVDCDKEEVFSTFHLHPNVEVKFSSAKCIVLCTESTRCTKLEITEGFFEIKDCLVSRDFNARCTSKKILAYSTLNEMGITRIETFVSVFKA